MKNLTEERHSFWTSNVTLIIIIIIIIIIIMGPRWHSG